MGARSKRIGEKQRSTEKYWDMAWSFNAAPWAEAGEVRVETEMNTRRSAEHRIAGGAGRIPCSNVI